MIWAYLYHWNKGFPDSSVGEESTCDAGDPSSIPGSGRSPGKGIGYPPQYSWAFLVAQLVKNLPTMWETWDPWVGKIPWRRERLPTSVFWPREFQGLYSPWSRKELGTTERISLTIETELGVFTIDLLSLLLLLHSLITICSFVPHKIITTETCSKATIVSRLRLQNGLGQNNLSQESHSWFSFCRELLTYLFRIILPTQLFSFFLNKRWNDLCVCACTRTHTHTHTQV